MKRSILFIMLAIAAFSSCKKDDSSVFNASPDERLNATLKRDQAALTGAPNGWKAALTTGVGVTYQFYFKFTDSNRVSMYSDFDTTTASVARESSYRLKGLQQPSLLFDTYSYIHLLADPDARVNGGSFGSGQSSDFEFAIDTATTDSVKLTGRFNGTKLRLLKATKQEADEWVNKNWYRAMSINNINRILNYFKQVTIGGITYEVAIDLLNKVITFTWVDAGGVAHTFTTGYRFSPNPEGIVFNTPLTAGTTVITGFYGFAFDAVASRLNFNTGTVSASLSGAIAPIKVDVAAPRRWWQYAVDNANAYWISASGFHVNGVDDAFGVTKLASGTSQYYYMIYWPKYNASYDFFGPIFLTTANSLTLSYGSAPRPPTFTANGRVIFTELGTLGTHPTTGAAASSRVQLYNANGYYLIQTSATTYDMVSALDAKTWISWEF